VLEYLKDVAERYLLRKGILCDEDDLQKIASSGHPVSLSLLTILRDY
jgi:hypothetical protein